MTESNYICFGFYNMLPKTAENLVLWFGLNWCTIYSLDLFGKHLAFDIQIFHKM